MDISESGLIPVAGFGIGSVEIFIFCSHGVNQLLYFHFVVVLLVMTNLVGG